MFSTTRRETDGSDINQLGMVRCDYPDPNSVRNTNPFCYSSSDWGQAHKNTCSVWFRKVEISMSFRAKSENSQCIVCGRPIGKKSFSGHGCSEACAKYVPTVLKLSHTEFDELESRAISTAGKAIVRYLVSINKTDIQKLTRPEWRMFTHLFAYELSLATADEVERASTC